MHLQLHAAAGAGPLAPCSCRRKPLSRGATTRPSVTKSLTGGGCEEPTSFRARLCGLNNAHVMRSIWYCSLPNIGRSKQEQEHMSYLSFQFPFFYFHADGSTSARTWRSQRLLT